MGNRQFVKRNWKQIWSFFEILHEIWVSLWDFSVISLIDQWPKFDNFVLLTKTSWHLGLETAIYLSLQYSLPLTSAGEAQCCSHKGRHSELSLPSKFLSQNQMEAGLGLSSFPFRMLRKQLTWWNLVGLYLILEVHFVKNTWWRMLRKICLF